MLLHDVVTTSRAIGATRSRNAKTDLVAGLLRASPTPELEVVLAWLSGSPRQRRTGLGWRSLAEPPAPAPTPTLDVVAVDTALEAAAALSGPGSIRARRELVDRLFGAATAAEQEWLRALVLGQLRQGALDACVQAAVARLAEVPVGEIRRAAMMAGSTVPVAVAALGATTPGEAIAALQGFGLVVGRPVLPMLASSAPDVGAALTKVGGGAVVVDAKLDGIRLQVHRRDGRVRAVTRSLDDITERLPEVVAVVSSLPGGDLVLDGEALVLDSDGRPVAFQDTAARTGSEASAGEQPVVHPFFFDLLHQDGHDLVDASLQERLAHLDTAVPPALRTRRLVTDDPQEAEAFARSVLADGHEGVVVKALASSYTAGRRGSEWVKVKPVHTLDLVVLAVEHGSGRRRGWLSNLHLGARNAATGELVMVGKTFKGLSDETLAWQTTRLRELQTHEDEWTVYVRPEQVVEIAVDGIQRSSRYPGGVALRFARVVGYRHDKSADQADTLDAVRALGAPAP